MTKKLFMTAFLAGTMTMGLQAQEEVDATTGATEQHHDATTGATDNKNELSGGKCCKNQMAKDTIWYNDLSYSKQSKEVSMNRNLYSSTKSGAADYMRDMDDIASFVTAHPGAKVSVVGYTTTSTVKTKSNKTTTTKRNSAENIKKALLSRGVSESAIMVDANGEEAKAENGIYKIGVVTVTGTETTDVPVMMKKYQLVEKPQPLEQSPTIKRVSKFMKAISRFHMGGYGEIAYTRGFYNDNPQRYKAPEDYKNAPGFGKFDLPHVALNFGYDLGRGWSLYCEVEYEHGGTATVYEREAEEGGEWESETEKGGEVELEQYWIQKSFAKWANLRVGHVIVPVGLNNAHHEPMNFFTVYRPEGENTVLPSTWHQTGIDFWGRYKDFRYEVQFLPGLNSDNFTQSGWTNEGAATAIEYEVANKYAVSLRIDNYTVKGLRLGLSGYYGHTVGNSYPAEENQSKYKGQCIIGSFDFTYNDHNWIIRGQADYGYLGDVDFFSGKAGVYNRINGKSPSHHTVLVAKNAYAIGIEAGYDFFSQIHKIRTAKHRQKMYIFGRYDNYSTCADHVSKAAYPYCKAQCVTVGINYMPIKHVVVKADYQYRFLRPGYNYNNEPSINFGIAYQGQFF